MLFRQLFDHASSTYTYLVADEETREAALIDAVREQVERDVELLAELDLTLVYALETHVHADHVTASGLLRERLGAETVLSAAAGAGCPDRLVEDGEVLRLGRLEIEARHTPGHTDGDVTYVVRDGGRPLAAFTGDTMLIRGCGRTDFQQGDAERLYDSVHRRIFSLPDETPIYPGHDYRGFTSSTVGEEKRLNRRLREDIGRAAFVEIMENLDLAQPKQIHVAVPANLRCGIEQPPEGVVEVSEEWVREHAEGLRLVDVREADELRGPLGAMPGAEHHPLATLPAALGAPDERTVVVFCRSGGRSARAAERLAEAGFTRVVSMAGGMTRWNALGYPAIGGGAARSPAECG